MSTQIECRKIGREDKRLIYTISTLCHNQTQNYIVTNKHTHAQTYNYGSMDFIRYYPD